MSETSLLMSQPAGKFVSELLNENIAFIDHEYKNNEPMPDPLDQNV